MFLKSYPIMLRKLLKIPKGVITRSHTQKDRQYNDQKKNDKRMNNDLQNITHKTKDRVTRTQLKTGMNSF
jgi:hypothetical protein